MNGLPFSREAFLDVFAAYNAQWWPVAIGFWLATVVALAAVLAGRDRRGWIYGLLALQWLWAATAYHAASFSRINPAAWAFAVAFAVEAALLAWYGVVRPLVRIDDDAAAWSARAGYAFVVYGLLYPAIVLAGPDAYPRAPTFGVPCPTVILTIGFLILSRPIPVAATIVPVLWSVVGGSAGFLLGMRADLVLPVAGAALAARAAALVFVHH